MRSWNSWGFLTILFKKEASLTIKFFKICGHPCTEHTTPFHKRDDVNVMSFSNNIYICGFVSFIACGAFDFIAYEYSYMMFPFCLLVRNICPIELLV